MSAGDHLRAAMRAAGLDYTGPIVADGRLHRFKSEGDHGKNSWFVLFPANHLIPAAGAFGCWRRGINNTWHAGDGRLSQADWQRVRRQWQEAAARHKAETSNRQKKARQSAAWIFDRAKPVVSHAYLTTKGVQRHGELRERHGLLVLPLRDINGELLSLQFIAPDNRFDGERNKSFLRGGRVAGCYYTVADKGDGPLLICEGYATGASVHEATGYATVCTMNCGNLLAVGQAARELWPQREIVICADNDKWTEGNPGLTKANAAAKAIRARLAVPQFAKTDAKPTDFNDLACLESFDAVNAQIGAAAVPEEDDQDTYARLAALPAAEYDRCRQTEADALGIRVATLDAEVEKLRGSTGGDLQGCAVDLPDVEPWPQPVDGATLLDAVAAAHTRYLALPPGAADAMALWVTHTHCYEAFEVSPRMNLTSPEKGCGKTTARDVLALFVPRSLATENLTAAVLLRLIEKHKPTVLADEYDSWLRDNEELRGLFNAGHRRGGQALRCEGDSHEVRAFKVFAPAALCGIGAVPGTLHDRSIVIRLTRAKPGEVAARFDPRETTAEKELCRKLARWTADNRKRLEACDPKLPDGAHNRLADNWRPLFAVAEIAGGGWPRRCAEAFAKLTAADDLDAHGIGTILLTDIAGIFEAECADRLPSARLAAALAEIEGRPWAEFGRTAKPITQNTLARQLKRFDVAPRTIKVADGTTAKGYHLADFADAFERYLPQTGVSIRNPVTTPVNIDDSDVSQPPPAESGLRSENAIIPNKEGLGYGVTVQEPQPAEDMTLL